MQINVSRDKVIVFLEYVLLILKRSRTFERCNIRLMYIDNNMHMEVDTHIHQPHNKSTKTYYGENKKITNNNYYQTTWVECEVHQYLYFFLFFIKFILNRIWIESMGKFSEQCVKVYLQVPSYISIYLDEIHTRLTRQRYMVQPYMVFVHIPHTHNPSARTTAAEKGGVSPAL